ncbi:hypothetical protein D3C72_789440 [compost metagenome]
MLTLLGSTLTTWGQISITGKVISNDDNLPIQGVNVVEKGTQNGTTTTQDGTFFLEVRDPNTTLIFSFIGMITQEFPLKGQKQIVVKAKWDCHKDFFDSQKVLFYANSGVINNPVGGQINFASPWILGGVVKGMYSYQTNLNENEYERAQIELAHYISNCNFDLDFRWSYRQALFSNELNFKANSFESDFNFRNLTLIAGYSHLNFKRVETNYNEIFSGAVIGAGTYFNIRLYPKAVAKISLYKDKIEYQAEIEGGHKGFSCFIKFYKLDSFNELSLGIGTCLNYKIKKQRKLE